MEKQKRRAKDRRDGRFIRDLDSYHVIMAHLLPRRTACESFLHVKIDLSQVAEYLKQKNKSGTQNRYTIFHVVAAAMVKLVVLRPQLNRFIAGRRFYQRDDVSLAFVVKRHFSDDGGEGILYLSFNKDDNIDVLAERIAQGSKAERSGSSSSTMDIVETLGRLPRFMLAAIMGVLRILDFFGRVPASITNGDPNYATLFITNLGSIKLDAAYHHLNDWGTNSLFISIGEKHQARFPIGDGASEYRPAINLGLTLDERIVDGFYCSRSIRLLKYLLEHPQLLDAPFGEETPYDS